MTEVFFYHLQRQPLEKVLPVLTAKCLERQWKVVIRAGSAERLKALDDLLWTFADESFLPHGLANDPQSSQQPVVLAMEEEATNAPDVCLLVDGVAPALPDHFKRLMILFDGNDAGALAIAREQYKTLRDQGHDLSYWQQDESGSWGKK
jgi:DNA polymerase III subunit chi